MPEASALVAAVAVAETRRNREKAMDKVRSSKFWKSEKGAVAATYALALTGLIMIGGVAFDYSRMATMDSELQSAADQAALAAASQLDRTPNAINRAVAQASNLVRNQTYMSNDIDTDQSLITIAAVTFFSTRADAEAGTNGFTANSQSASANFVRVTVDSRKAFYAFTPIVGALTSPSINALATAGMGASVCKVPPLMMCNPGATASSVDIDNMIGKGILLKAKGPNSAWAPGDFGFLDVGAGANDLGKLLGFSNPPGDCVSVDTVTTEPGQMTGVMNEFNTRFDIYDGGDNIDCYSGSKCPPSDNSRKDVVQNADLNAGSALTKNDCDIKKDNNGNQQQGKGGQGWRVSPDPYRPTTAERCNQKNCSELGNALPDAMGYPRDICHAWSNNGNCGGGRIGDGTWDVNAYWQVTYGAAYSSQVNGKSAPTRYEVYKWERTNGASFRPFDSPNGGNGNRYTDFKAPKCRAGLAPGATTPDRRVLPVAVIDCTNLQGKVSVTPLDWMDVFLVEPSIKRKVTKIVKGKGSDPDIITDTVYTDIGDIYVEVIGRTGQGAGGAANQYVRRDKPYLVN
jgi:Flp pilus assembly protein TadG